MSCQALIQNRGRGLSSKQDLMKTVPNLVTLHELQE